MPSKTKSQLLAEIATLRARLAKLEGRLADHASGKGRSLRRIWPSASRSRTR
jgi:hypothetical protein